MRKTTFEGNPTSRIPVGHLNVVSDNVKPLRAVRGDASPIYTKSLRAARGDVSLLSFNEMNSHKTLEGGLASRIPAGPNNGLMNIMPLGAARGSASSTSTSDTTKANTHGLDSVNLPMVRVIHERDCFPTQNDNFINVYTDNPRRSSIEALLPHFERRALNNDRRVFRGTKPLTCTGRGECIRLHVLHAFAKEAQKNYPLGAHQPYHVFAHRIYHMYKYVSFVSFPTDTKTCVTISDYCGDVKHLCSAKILVKTSSFNKMWQQAIMSLLPQVQMMTDTLLGKDPDIDIATNTALSSQTEVAEAGHSHSIPLSVKYANTEMNYSFPSIMNRWIRLKQFQISTSDVAGTSILTIEFPKDLYVDTLSSYILPFETMMMMSGMELVLRVKVATQPFMAGIYMISLLPIPEGLYRPVYQTLNASLSRIHQLMDVSSQTEIELVIPFEYHRAFVFNQAPTSVDVTAATYCAISIIPIAPLNTATGQSNTAYGSVMISIREATFAGMTYRQTPTVQGPLHDALDVAATVGNAVVTFNGFIKSLDKCFSRFGIPFALLDKPYDWHSTQVVPRPSIGMPWSKGPSHYMPMIFDPMSTTSSPDEFVSSMFDGNMTTLLKKETILAQFSWTVDNAPGTVLFTSAINPSNFSITEINSQIGPTGLEYLTSMFMFYRGTIVFSFIFAATDLNRGSIIMSVETGRYTTDDEFSTTATYTQNYDIGTVRKAEIRVPYMYDTVMRRTGNYGYYSALGQALPVATHYGPSVSPFPIMRVRVRVLNELRAASTVPDKVLVTVMVSGSDDYMLKYPGISMVKPNSTVPGLLQNFPQDDTVFTPGPPDTNIVDSEKALNVYDVLQRPVQIFCEYPVTRRTKASIEGLILPVMPPQACWTLTQPYLDNTPYLFVCSPIVNIMRMFRSYRGPQNYDIIVHSTTPIIVYVSYMPSTGATMVGSMTKFDRSLTTDRHNNPASVGLPTQVIATGINPTLSISVPFGTENNFLLMNKNLDSTLTWADNGDYNAGHLLIWSTDADFTVDIFWSAGDGFRLAHFLGFPSGSTLLQNPVFNDKTIHSATTVKRSTGLTFTVAEGTTSAAVTGGETTTTATVTTARRSTASVQDASTTPFVEQGNVVYPRTSSESVRFASEAEVILTPSVYNKVVKYADNANLQVDSLINPAHTFLYSHVAMKGEDIIVSIPGSPRFLARMGFSHEYTWVKVINKLPRTQMFSGFRDRVASLVSSIGSSQAVPAAAAIVGTVYPPAAPALSAVATSYVAMKVSKNVDESMPKINGTIDSVNLACHHATQMFDKVNGLANTSEAIINELASIMFPTVNMAGMLSNVSDVLTNAYIAFRSDKVDIKVISVLNMLKALGFSITSSLPHIVQMRSVLTRLFTSSVEVQADGGTQDEILSGLFGFMVAMVSATLGVTAPRVSAAEHVSWMGIFSRSMMTPGSWSLVRNASMIFKPFVVLIRKITYWVMGTVDPDANILILAGQQSVVIKTFVDDVMRIRSPANSVYLRTSRGKFDAWRVFCMAEQIIRALTGPQMTSPMMTLYSLARSYIQWMQEKFLTLTTCPVRWEPFVLWINGPSRVGKSYLTTHLVTALFKSLNITIPGSEAIFKRTPAKKFWDGYVDQPVIVYDDFGNITLPDIMATQMDELYQLKTSQPMNVEMARLEEKEIRANPILVIVLSNKAFNIGNNVLRTDSAFYGRRDMMWEVEKTGQIVSNSLEPDFSHLSFRQYLDVTDINSKSTQKVDFNQFFGDVVSRMKNFVDTERINVVRRMTSLMEICRVGAHALPQLEDPFALITSANRIIANEPLNYQNVDTPADALNAEIERLAQLVDAREPVQIPVPISTGPQLSLGEQIKNCQSDDFYDPLYERVRMMKRANVDLGVYSTIELPEDRGIEAPPRPLVPQTATVRNTVVEIDASSIPDPEASTSTAQAQADIPSFGFFSGLVRRLGNYVYDKAAIVLDDWYDSVQTSSSTVVNCSVCYAIKPARALCENSVTDNVHSVCGSCYRQLVTRICPLCRGTLHDADDTNDILFKSFKRLGITSMKVGLRILIAMAKILASGIDARQLINCYMEVEMYTSLYYGTPEYNWKIPLLARTLAVIQMLLAVWIDGDGNFYRFFLRNQPQVDVVVDSLDTVDTQPLPNFVMPPILDLPICSHRIAGRSSVPDPRWYDADNVHEFRFTVRGERDTRTIDLRPCNENCYLLEQVPPTIMRESRSRLQHFMERYYLFRQSLINTQFHANPEDARRIYPDWMLPSEQEVIMHEQSMTIYGWLSDIASRWWEFLTNISWRRIALIVGPVCAVAAAGAYAYHRFFSHEQLDPPEVEAYAYSQPRGLPVSRQVPQNRALVQSMETSYRSVINKIIGNTVYVYCRYGSRYSRMIATGLCSRTAIIPKHYVHHLSRDGAYITISREKVPNYTLEYEYRREDFVVMDDTDWAVWYMPPQLGMFSNIIKYIQTEEQAVKPLPQNLVIVNMSFKGGVEGLPKLCDVKFLGIEESMPSLGDGRIYNVLKAISYNMAYTGMCGCFVLKPSGERPIVGMHVSGTGDGYGQRGYAVPLHHGNFDVARPYDAETPSGLQEVDRSTMSFEQGLSLRVCGTIPRSKVPRQPTKSKIEPSLINGKLSHAPSTFPVCLSRNDPRWEHAKSPLLSGCEKHGIITQDFPRDVLDTISESVSQWVKYIPPVKPPKVRTIVEAIEGFQGEEYYDSMDLNTSAGYPWCVTDGKTRKSDWIERDADGKVVSIDARVEARVKESWDIMATGCTDPPIFIDLLKDERRTMEKLTKLGGTRIICMAPLDNHIITRQLLMDFFASFMSARHKYGHAVGINPDSPEWGEIARRLTRFGHDDICTIDYSNFGPSYNQAIARIVSSAIRAWLQQNGYSERELVVYDMVMENLDSSFHLMLNVVYQQFSGNPSGSTPTTVKNTLVNFCLLFAAWLCMCDDQIQKGNLEYAKYRNFESFMEYVERVLYGDDGCFSVAKKFKEFFNSLTVTLLLQKYNIVASDASKTDVVQKYVPLHEVSFLQRGFKKHPMWEREYLAPLRERTIWDCAQYVWKSDTPEATTRENAEQAIRLSYGHGPDKFNEIRDEINDKLRENGIDPVLLFWNDIDRINFASYYGEVVPFQQLSENVRLYRLGEPDMTIVAKVSYGRTDIDPEDLEVDIRDILPDYDNSPDSHHPMRGTYTRKVMIM